MYLNNCLGVISLRWQADAWRER